MMGSLANWGIGYIFANILIVIVIVGTQSLTTDATQEVNNISFNASLTTADDISQTDIAVWDSFDWSVTGLPYWLDLILLMDVIIGIVLLILVLRGAN